MMPAGPSKRPPDGTVSECDPNRMGSAARLPSSRPIRFPPASRRTASPASSKRRRSQARPSRNRGEKDRRWPRAPSDRPRFAFGRSDLRMSPSGSLFNDGWTNEDALARPGEHGLAVADQSPAQKRRDRAIGKFDAGVGAPGHEVMAARRRVVAAGIMGHHDQIGVPAGLDGPLAMPETKQARGIGGEEPGRPRDIEPALKQPSDQQRIKDLEPGDAGGVRQHFGIGFAILRPADVVGGDDRDVARGQMAPERLHFAPWPDRRVDLGLADEARNVVLFVQDQIMDAGFDRRIEPLPPIRLAEVVAATDRAMDDMRRAA